MIFSPQIVFISVQSCFRSLFCSTTKFFRFFISIAFWFVLIDGSNIFVISFFLIVNDHWTNYFNIVDCVNLCIFGSIQWKRIPCVEQQFPNKICMHFALEWKSSQQNMCFFLQNQLRQLHKINRIEQAVNVNCYLISQKIYSAIEIPFSIELKQQWKLYNGGKSKM